MTISPLKKDGGKRPRKGGPRQISKATTATAATAAALKKQKRTGMDGHREADEDDRGTSLERGAADEQEEEAGDEEAVGPSKNDSTEAPSTEKERLYEKMLFGEDQKWKTIEKARVDVLGNGLDRGSTRAEMQPLRNGFLSIRSLFRSLADPLRDDSPPQELEQRIAREVRRLEKAAEWKQRPKKLSQTRLVVCELYASVLPAAIRTLDLMMQSRVSITSARAYTVVHLTQIIQLQEVVLKVVSNIYAWKEGPDAGERLTIIVKNDIIPNLRYIHKVFKQKLQIFERDERNEANYARYHAQPLASQEEENVPNTVEQTALQRYRQCIEEERSRWRKRPIVSHQPVWPKARTSPEGDGSGWTGEEDNALIAELCNNKATRKLPGKSSHITLAHGFCR